MLQYGLVVLNGLSWGMVVFLAAAGLTLVFGILNVLNFAHGGFVMLGAYLAYTILNHIPGGSSIWVFMLVCTACALILGAAGAVVDRLVFRPLRGVSEAYSLIATYALLLVCQGLVKLIWGIDFLSVSPPNILSGAMQMGSLIVPNFVLFVVINGLVVFFGLDYFIHRTSLGKTIKSVAVDPWMSSLLGINVGAVLAGTVALGVALGGAAGAILSINQSLSPELGGSLIIQAFGVIVVGGMGNIRGAFLAALALGMITAFGDWFVRDIPSLFFYVALVLLLMWRPQGLLQRGR